ncbi:titin [Diorhabda carinulata]|uniref:titin n=1 Tax=Diorhabda carinulata TaxID=1163345 RepID=UPI0025A146C5|nr:titin [Diorhabda carinulata]
MESGNKKVRKEKKLPRVPIKTYKWEDVKRSRRRGGYPWTYLYKEPYKENLDPEQFTMEGMRKAKSTSTMGKSEDMDISEVSTFDNQSSYMIEEIGITNTEIKDPQNHSIKTSCSSLIVDEEQCDDSDAKETDGITKTNYAKHEEKDEKSNPVVEKVSLSPGMFFLHSEESLDNISQYLDKDERGPSVKLNKDDKKSSQEEEEEEGPSRKRKLSLESSRSKISFGKQAILQKLKNTKEKMKIPKISFPTKIKKNNKKQKHSPQPELKKSAEKHSVFPPQNSRPVYIHIPLKPPPGEIDQFQRESEARTVRKPNSFKDLVRNLKQLQENKIEHESPPSIVELKEEEELCEKDESNEVVERENITPIPAKEDEVPIPKIDPQDKSTPANVETIQIIELTEEVSENEHTTSDKLQITELNIVDEKMKTEDVLDEIDEKVETNEEDEFEIIEENYTDEVAVDNSDEIPTSSTPETDLFDKLFEVSASRPRTDSEIVGRKTRSKSAEPERKRKLSLESSYSRKSLSKLGILKKLRDAKDKIKDKFTRASSKKDVKVEEPVKIEQKQKNLKPQKEVKPVYIHIPLKPPDGTTDEFSQLENESRSEIQRTETTSSTPDSPDKLRGDVQFIILTAPSDDEVLDYNSSDVPETPSSENKVFFPSKVHELKEIAKGAVDQITGSTTKLAPVTEETSSPKNSIENISNAIKEEEKLFKTIEKSCVEDIIKQVVEKEKLVDKNSKRVTVDEEDGLNESKLKEVSEEDSDNKIVDESIEMKINEESKPAIIDTGVQNVENMKIISMESDEILDLEEAEIDDDDDEKKGEELKSVLKSPSSPIMKKRVSFKRKVKSKNGSYEDIKIPETEEKEKEIEKFPSMPTEEEDVYMEEKTVRDISNEEKRNRWSKISDHEYEPVNPPPDNIEIIPTVTLNNSPVCLIDTAQAFSTPDPLSFTLSKPSTENETSNLQKSPKSQRVAFSTTTDSHSSESNPKPKEGPSKFQMVFKQKADNIRNKLHNMKRPHINMPERPKFHKPNFHKPNFQKFKIERKFNMPKIPDTAKINLPSFNLPHIQIKKSIKRNVSTESNAGDSKKPIFDFGTYPRIFKKKPKSDEAVSDFATVPRAKKPDSRTTEDSRDSRFSATDSIRIPLHSEDSMDRETSQTARDIPSDSSDIKQPSHIRYNEGIDSEDEFDQENREMMDERDFLSRWERGRFNPDEFVEKQINTKITDLDSPDDKGYDFPPDNQQEQRYSSGSSLGVHRKGVLEEINPDEFFLRQKGISQDNIEVGMYLSTEIREAFRNPTNALLQMEDDNNFTIKGSHTSLPEITNKTKPIKKPKRKKTPHASHEKMPYADEESADDETNTLPPSRPKRRSKRKKKTNENFIPYQETIPVDSAEERMVQHRESVDVFADDEREIMYENEIMEGKEQPEIKIINPYKNYGYEEEELEVEEAEEEINQEHIPEAPPRRQKSLKSLTHYENDSMFRLGPKMHQAIFERRVTEPGIITYKSDAIIPERKSYHMNVTQPEIRSVGNIEAEEPAFEVGGFYGDYKYLERDINIVPEAPPRKQKSLKSLNISENESYVESLSSNRAKFSSENNLQEPVIDAIRTNSKIIIPIETETVSPKRPSRSRSQGNSRSRDASRSRTGSLSQNASHKDLDISSLQTSSFTMDESTPCVEDAVPCAEEPCIQKICDYMGYSVVDKSKIRDPPLPPPRTLGRKKRSTKLNQENKFFTVPRTKDSKEKSDETPVRPLRNYSTLAQNRNSVTPDIVENKENIDITQYIEIDEEPTRDLQSGEIIEKMKARPLPAPPRPPRKTKHLQDITSRENIMSESTEELQKEVTRETEVYTQTEPLPDDFVCEEVTQEPTDKIIIPTQVADAPRVERRFVTPTSYSFEETVTHGSLLVEPLNGVKLLPDSDISEKPKETIIPVDVEDDFDETSSIPDNFHKLTDPTLPKQTASGELDILKAQKLEVADLDVDTLTVNKLLAGKIVVSEIDSTSIFTNEISSKSGALKIGEISLPPEMLSQILKNIQSRPDSEDNQQDASDEQKKTPIESYSTETSPNYPNLAVIDYVEEEKLLDTHQMVPDEEIEEINSENKGEKLLDTPQTVPDERIEEINSENKASDVEVSEEVDSKKASVDEPKIFSKHESSEDVPEVDMVKDDVPYGLISEKYYSETASPVVPSKCAEISVPSEEIKESPPIIPPRSLSQDEFFSQEHEPIPHRPPRQSERLRTSQSANEESMKEPDVDDEPPPRPPEPPMGYIPSQPPTSFYALRAQKYVDENIPTVPRRRRHTKAKQVRRSSSEDSSEVSLTVRRHHRRSSDQSIVQLSGQLVRACGSEANNQLKRLINYILNNVLHNEDGKQDLNVMIIIILVLIVGLLLLGYGEERTVIHLHHWEYFNPPKNL